MTQSQIRQKVLIRQWVITLYCNDDLGDALSPQQKAAFLVQPKNKDGDQTGVIRNATQEERQENPLRALGKDILHGILSLAGLNTADDVSAEVQEKTIMVI